ncbi:MAG: glutamine amidotransferase [Spirochaetes bacterium]|nr:glutamine amidotransferase [Spirochaetota bacterium]MBN2770839.1 glutamine amidotransferase [Spirochaetota bacterium]
MNAYLYVLNTLADWEIGYLTAELNSGRYLDKTKSPVRLIKISNSTDPVQTMGGMLITPDKSVDDISFKDSDLLILPGADTWLEESNNKILDIVCDLLEKNVIIAAICGATVALAKKGILNNRKHISIAKEYLKMTCPEYTGEQFYENRPAVIDGNLITATGLAPLDFTYEIFKKTGVMKPETLEAWYQLFKTKEAEYFYSLMESLN